MIHIVKSMTHKKLKRDTIVHKWFKILINRVESCLISLSGINWSKENVVTARRTANGSQNISVPFCLPRFANRNRDERLKYENEGPAFSYCSLYFF
jgi:hypothetical protein